MTRLVRKLYIYIYIYYLIPTLVIESEAHVHKCFSRREVVCFVTFKQRHGEILHETVEDLLVYTLTGHTLQIYR